MTDDPSFVAVTRWLEVNEEAVELHTGEHVETGFQAIVPEAERSALGDDELLSAWDLGDDCAVTDEMRLRFLREHFQCLFEECAADPDAHPLCMGFEIRASSGRRAVLGLGVRGYSFSGVSITWYGLFEDRDDFSAWARQQGWLLDRGDLEAMQPEQLLTLWPNRPRREGQGK